MTQFEIKEKVISKINDLDDDFVFNEIYNILENNNNGMYVLNEPQKEDINIALKQIEEGKYLTNNVANSEVSQWLNK